MSLNEWLTNMMAIAIGWLGMSEQEALDTDINLILSAYRQAQEKALAYQGIWPKAPKRKPPRKNLQDFEKSHNAAIARRKPRTSKGKPA